MGRRIFLGCAVILILAGLLFGCGRTGQESSSVSAWPMFRYDLQHTGRSPYVGSQTNAVEWRFETGAPVSSSPAVARDGTVYVGSDDGYLYAINPDGTSKWKFETGDYVESSPAIAKDGTIYVGSYDGYLYAINPDGTLRWKFETGNSVFSSPALATNGTIYVGSNDGYLYAIDADGTLKWKFETGDYVPSSPSVANDGAVYVGSADGHLYAINLDGTLRWEFEIDATVSSSPAIAKDGTVYVGSEDGYLYAIDSNGRFKWNFETETGDYDASSPAIAKDGTVCVGSEDGYLYAINDDGTLKWKFQTGDCVYSSPAIAKDGTVYVGSGDLFAGSQDNGYLYAINPDGTLKWKFETAAVFSSPAIAKYGVIYVGSGDGYLYAIGERAVASREQPSPTQLARSTTDKDIKEITEIIKKEDIFFNTGNWKACYGLYSTAYRSAFSYPEFVESMNEALAGMHTLYQGEIESSNIEIVIKGKIAYATYITKVGGDVIQSVTETNPDVFIKVNGKWYDTAEDPSDPGYNEEDIKVERETVVWQVPKEFSTVQSAIDVARPGVTVLVSKEIYKENLEIKKPVTLKATGEVVIKAADINEPVISLKKEAKDWWESFQSSAIKGDVVINGLILQGGKRGLSIESPSFSELETLMPVTLEHCTIQNNAEAGVYVAGRGKTTLMDCTIQHNGNYGIVLYHNIINGTPSATLDRCIITGNKYGLGFFYGSAIGEATPVNTLDTIAGNNNRIYGNSVQDLIPATGWPAGF